MEYIGIRPSSKVYFPNLNGIRFFAAILVVVHHIEQIKNFFGLSNHWLSSPAIVLIGKLGVVLFFVLSGFLITYLLLVEKRDTQTISIKNFYIRRVLRIWPLYLIIVLLGLYILPHIELFNIPIYDKEYTQDKLELKSIFYFLFLSNVALPLFQYMPHISQTWSIGVEEQFYLIWPLLFSKIKANKYYILVSFIIAYLLVNVFLYLLPEFTYKGFLINFWENHFNIDCMVIGALFAMIYFNREKKVLNVLYHKYAQWFVFAITPILMYNGFVFPYLNYEIYAILFGIIILNLSTNPNTLSIEYKWLNSLGKISYGVYMYHPIMIVLTIKILLALDIVNNWTLYPLTIVSTLLISILSYHFAESKLLKLKVNFSNIISGDNAIGSNNNYENLRLQTIHKDKKRNPVPVYE